MLKVFKSIYYVINKVSRSFVDALKRIFKGPRAVTLAAFFLAFIALSFVGGYWFAIYRELSEDIYGGQTSVSQYDVTAAKEDNPVDKQISQENTKSQNDSTSTSVDTTASSQNSLFQGIITRPPDWVQDTVSGDWYYSYDIVMESTQSSDVRTMDNGIVKAVQKIGDDWSVSVGYEEGIAVTYSSLSDIAVTTGLKVTKGQTIGKAVEVGDAFVLRLSASQNGEPRNPLDYIQ